MIHVRHSPAMAVAQVLAQLHEASCRRQTTAALIWNAPSWGQWDGPEALGDTGCLMQCLLKAGTLCLPLAFWTWWTVTSPVEALVAAWHFWGREEGLLIGDSDTVCSKSNLSQYLYIIVPGKESEAQRGSQLHPSLSGELTAELNPKLTSFT